MKSSTARGCPLESADRRPPRGGRAHLLSYVATFLASSAALAGAPAESPIYPRPERVLRFSHAKHAAVPCARCHGEVHKSLSGRTRDLPGESACRPCHRENTRPSDLVPTRAELGRAERCATCHLGYDGAGVPAKLRWPQTRLRFSHRMHAQREVACSACHDFGKARPLPSMATCTECHRARAITNRCAACHLTAKDGRLLLSFGEDRLFPSGSLVPGTAHTPLFFRRHADVARANRGYCETCHAPESCLSCHAGQFKPLQIHRSDYVSHHALDARRDEPRCVSCHRTQSFCLSCHERTGVAPNARRGGFKPNTGVAFHPPGFSSLRAGPGHHKFSARRNITSCASCHDEGSCIACHGSSARRRGGFSPHPPNFGASLKCRSLQSRNRRVCLKCHTDGEARCR